MKTVSSKVKFIRSIFGHCDLDRSGENVAVSCPSCKTSSKKKLSINLVTWQTHCWVCGLKGKTLFPILAKYFGRDRANNFANEFLSDDIKKTLNQKNEESVELRLPEGFVFLGIKENLNDPDLKACFRYLTKRGISENEIWYFKMGAITTGRYRRRVMIPSFDHLGNLNYFVARSIDSDGNYKYINAPTDKKSIIFNEQNIDWTKELTLVEGPFDLIKANQNATCLLGSSLTKEALLFRKIIKNRTPVVLALDSDMCHKAQKIAALLSSYDCQVRIIDLGESTDVGEMSKKEFNNILASAKIWERDNSLMMKISSIGSGSIL